MIKGGRVQLTRVVLLAAGVLHVSLGNSQLALDLPLPVLRVHVQHLSLE